MDAEGDGVANRGAVEFLREVLVVESVAAFVQDPIQRAGEIALVVARGEARVFWTEPRAERMRRGVNAACLEIEAEGGGDLLVELLLGFGRVVALESIGRNGLGFFVSGGGDIDQL